MDLKKIEKLIQLLKKHGLHEIEVESEEQKVRLCASPSYSAMPAQIPQFAAQQYVAPPAAHEGVRVAAEIGKSGKTEKQIRSPFVGTFYESASPGSAPFVVAGQKVKKGDVLCIVEAMKIMNEIEAETDCVIKEVLVQNEQPIEFDQPLFSLE